jgi:antitoxin (DNA-binding transcriptional repressor) of toxin-antitoxin stability system
LGHVPAGDDPRAVTFICICAWTRSVQFKIVGWQAYAEESSAQASEVLKDLCAREDIRPNQVILHSDNGGPMNGDTMLATLQTLRMMPLAVKSNPRLACLILQSSQPSIYLPTQSYIEQGKEREIVISRNGRPVAKLVPIDRVPGERRIGVAKGVFEVPDTIDAHSDELAELFGGESSHESAS